MRTLHINVLDKKATYLSRDGDIVCGNSDYMIEFAFDAEWDGYDEKTARFIWNGQYQDVKFVGAACYVPIVTHTSELRVGVYAGELSTTTSATIPCQKSILCDSSSRGGTVIINGGSGDGAGVPVPTADDNGKVLTAEDGKAKWKEPTGGEGVTMVVNVSRADDDTYSSDKTIAEILEAYDKGKQIAFDVLHSGYHWIFTDGWIAITNKTPYQGVMQYTNDVMYFTADNAMTENNVDSFRTSMKEPTGGSVVAVEASQLEGLDFAKYPAGTLIVGYADIDEEDIAGVAEQ